MKIDVTNIAKLANLTLNADEKKKFEEQLIETLTYIEQLQEVNTENVEITPQVTRLENVLDEDVIRSSLSQADALNNADATHKGYFKVKAILKDST